MLKYCQTNVTGILTREGEKKTNKKKYGHQRIDMTVRISPTLYSIIDEMSYNLKITKNDLILLALLKTYDKGEQCPDRSQVTQIF